MPVVPRPLDGDIGGCIAANESWTNLDTSWMLDPSSLGVSKLVSAADDDCHVPRVLKEEHEARAWGSRAEEDVVLWPSCSRHEFPMVG